MNQELEDRANSFRNMIVDFNRGVITTKDAIKKELLALNKLNNSDYHLYFYTYKTQDNKIVDRVCGLDLHSELFLKGLEQLNIDLSNYTIRYTENGPVLDLNNQLFLDRRDLETSKFIEITVNKNDLNCAFVGASFVHSLEADNKTISIYFAHKVVVGFYIEIKKNRR